jgi:hypothetical protein
MQSVASLGAGRRVLASVPFQVPSPLSDGPVTAGGLLDPVRCGGSSYGPVTYVLRHSGHQSQRPPLVSAGPSQTVTLPESTVTLAGHRHRRWPPRRRRAERAGAQLSGPGAVVFANSTLPVTTRAFSDAGLYVLRLTASDSDVQLERRGSRARSSCRPARRRPWPSVARPTARDHLATDIVGSVSNGL